MKLMRFFLALYLLAANFSGKAQINDTIRIREFGLGFSNFKSYTLQYRWGTQKKLWRVSANSDLTNSVENTNSANQVSDSLYRSYTESRENKPFRFNGGLNFGILHLRPLSDNFGVFYGPALYANYSYMSLHVSTPESVFSSSQSYGYYGNQRNSSVTVGAGLTLGLSLKVSSSFFIYAEITPQVFYGYTTSNSNMVSYSDAFGTRTNRTNSVASTYGLRGISNSNALITLAYRVPKK